ncbi:MAG: hypothetical protein ACM3XM_05535 [Mycobacterium leprae]
MGKRRGIQFVVSPPTPEDRLPRMDVAAFVGFAAAGPLHTPVQVEDEVHFRQIFGPDLLLARDEEQGTICAFLGPAVRAFFANGGRLCWVVRVASQSDAIPNRFAVPGLVWATPDGKIRGAQAVARSPGSWSDALRVGTLLRRTPLGEARLIEPADSTHDPHYVTLALDPHRVPDPIRPGDLLRLAFAGGEVAFVAARQVAEPTADLPERRLTGEAWWFTSRAPTSLGKAADLMVDGLGPTGAQRLKAQWLSGPPRLAFAAGTVVLPGVTLTLKVSGATGYATVQAIRSESLGVVVTISEPHWTLSTPPAAGSRPVLERLTFDLMATDSQGASRLTELGFGGEHPRFFGALPTDEALFCDKAAAVSDAVTPRFPLAAEERREAVCLPIGMGIVWQPEALAGAFDTGKPALERDGLVNLTPDLFADPDLARQGPATLGNAIFARQDEHQRAGRTGPALTGIHALWPLDEVTLVSAPDCLHRQWVRAEPVEPSPLPAPVLRGRKRLTWNRVATGARYLFQESTDPTFQQAVTSSYPEVAAFTPATSEACLHNLYYRVRAELGDRVSPWSNTQQITLAHSPFRPLHWRPLPAPQLADPEVSQGSCRLNWTRGEGTQFTLESATVPDFTDSQTVYAGNETGATVVWGGAGVLYFRVRAQGSPWSRTVTIQSKPPSAGWVVQRDSRPPIAAAVQQALLCMAEARGDLMAVLSLPWQGGADRLRGALSYLGQLTGEAGAEPERRLSYGAIYHPWLLTDGLLVPPEGAATGRIADRAVRRGAWVAPANEALTGVVQLAPPITGSEADALRDRQVNVVERTPQGFMLLSADTLSPDRDLMVMGVRRLLILLRRLALREGQSLLFEPTSDPFRRLVQRRFEALLTGLYGRGAFAGDRPEEGFQVVTDESVNPPAALEQGRFVVELRVAPSRPLAFILVRLVQAAGAEPVVKEV